MHAKMHNDLDTLAKRIKYFRELKGWSQAQLAKQILVKDKETGELKPIDPSVIGNIENRNSEKSKYTPDFAKALGVNLEWLMSGDGQPTNATIATQSQIFATQNDLNPSSQTQSTAMGVEEPKTEYVIIGGTTDYPLVFVDYLNKKASCGGGYANEEYNENEKGKIAFTVEFLQENDLPIDGIGLVLMHACGDSMGYTIPDETLMLVNKKECQFENMISKQIYVFNADGEMICKRAFKNLDGSITLVSDNNDKMLYPDQLVKRDKYNHFAIFGRVRYTFNKL